MNPMLLFALGGGLAFIMLLIGIGIVVSSGRSVVDDRLGKYVESAQPVQAAGKAQKQGAITSWLNNRVENTKTGGKISRNLARADLKLKPGEYIALMVIAAFGVGLIAWFLGGKSVVVGLIGALEYESAHIVGHDWGGGLAWALAGARPELVRSLTILNAPQGPVSARLRREDPEQQAKSWYMLLFQFVGVAEAWLSGDDFRNLRRFVFEDAAPGTFTDEDQRVYLDALRKDGALTAALNYYRANMPAASLLRDPPEPPEITVPTMIIWGEADSNMSLKLLERSAAAVSGPLRIERLAGVSHWVQQEAPDAVNALLVDFLDARRAADG